MLTPVVDECHDLNKLGTAPLNRDTIDLQKSMSYGF